MFRRIVTAWIPSILLIAFDPGAILVAGDAGVAAPTRIEIRQLIEQLGSDNYNTRTRARDRLQQFGLEAFDELQLAQSHPDLEIEMAARFLISSLQVRWAKESDPKPIRETLHEYGAQDESERANRIEMLAEFPRRSGLEALARLTRFETSLRLSRLAALTLMKQPMGESATDRRRHAERITRVIGDSDRQAVKWLRIYAADLRAGDYSSDLWRDLIAGERRRVDAAATEQSTRETVLELVRTCATRAAAAGHRNEALRLAVDQIDLITPTSRGLSEATSWAIDHQLHDFVLELQQRYDRIFERKPILLYAAAEANRVGGNADAAERLAEQALSIRPLDGDDDDPPLENVDRERREEDAEAHREIAQRLQQRGLFDWAEREYRTIIENLPIDSRAAVSTRVDAATMYGEMLRHADVVATLKPLLDRLTKDDQAKDRFLRIYRDLGWLRSEVEYHSALSELANGNSPAIRERLLRAYRSNPINIDILIAMYRLDGDARWDRIVDSELRVAIRRSEGQVQAAVGNMRLRKVSNDRYVASAYNQYAWLVSNTEGDYAKALQRSLQSLEIDPDAAKYDTCARCYYAVGDLENAILMQNRALKLMPHSPPLKRQLAEFESAKEP